MRVRHQSNRCLLTRHANLRTMSICNTWYIQSAFISFRWRERFCLRARYQSKIPGECSPGDGTPLIVYKNLMSDIEAVFTVKGLEKKSATTNVEQVHMYYIYIYMYYIYMYYIYIYIFMLLSYGILKRHFTMYGILKRATIRIVVPLSAIIHSPVVIHMYVSCTGVLTTVEFYGAGPPKSLQQ